jgi:predicted nucleic acid-binding protein
VTVATRLGIAVVDTSVLLAAFSFKDHLHHEAVAALSLAPTLVVSPMVMTELDYMMTRRAGEAEAVNAVTRIGALAGQGVVLLPSIERSHYAEAEAIMRQYQGHALGLADAINAVLAWRLKRPAILSFDQHYSTHFAPRRTREARLEVFPSPCRS